MRYGLIGVFGPRGKGKTTYCVKYALKHALKPTLYKKVYSNIHITHPGANIEFITLDDLERMQGSNEQGVPDKLVFLDQLHKYCPANRFMSIENNEFIEVLIESRQHGFDIIGDTWGYRALDPRMRKYFELIISAHRVSGGFLYRRVDAGSAAEIPSEKMPLSQAQEVWPWFNNNEIVQVRREEEELVQ